MFYALGPPKILSSGGSHRLGLFTSSSGLHVSAGEEQTCHLHPASRCNPTNGIPLSGSRDNCKLQAQRVGLKSILYLPVAVEENARYPIEMSLPLAFMN